jgi:hypothetical protein
MKVSFDFDSTLDNQNIQNFAVKLMNEGFDVHIVTSRPTHWTMDEVWDNSDLFAVAEVLNIPREKIHFTDYKPKKLFFLQNPDFIFHLDDDHIEIEEISHATKVKAVLFDENWESNINSLFDKI